MDSSSDNPNRKASRRDNRLAAAQFLYMWDINEGKTFDKAFEDFFQIEPPKKRGEYHFMEDLVRGVLGNINVVDENIDKYSKNWMFSRIAKTDLAILRLAIYELLFRKDIPPVVSINEAIDLAKSFSNEDSKRFVNGILDKVKETLDRPFRSSGKSKEEN